MEPKGKIVVGVLDWGLGHATRSTVVIGKLIQQGWEPILASSSLALTYLKKEWPQLEALELPSYNMRYSEGKNQLLKIAQQLPHIKSVIQKEHKWLDAYINGTDNIKGVISDNRLGLYSNQVPSVYITHQLSIKAQFISGLASSLHQKYILCFDQCWVPDFNDPIHNLSGELAHKIKLKIRTEFLGPLSRYTHREQEHNPIRYKYTAILSGPEPQRQLLENKIISFFNSLDEKCALVRGTNSQLTQGVNKNIEVFDIADSHELFTIINSSELLIGRCGYSSIMDYYYLGKKAFLVPTPGQTEQEYLAQRFMEKGWFYSNSQSKINFEQDLLRAEGYSGLEEVRREEVDWNRLFSLFEGKGEG